jgi:cytochrome c oxidase subunit 2
VENKRGVSTGQAFGIALFLAVMTLVTVYVFVAKTWWMPESISRFAEGIDAQFHRTLWICGVIFFLAQLALAFVVFRFRGQAATADHSHGNTKLEVIWTSATAILFVGLGLLGERAWAALHFTGASPGALQVEVTGQQFAWNFRYPGPDGTLGRTDPKLISDSSGNPLGLDPADPASADDVVAATLAVPVSREVELTLRSKDVTHGFFVRELRLKQDAVPGLRIKIHFTAEKEGQYEIVCAELCGLGHHRMRAFLQVKPEADFEAWLEEQAPTQ